MKAVHLHPFLTLDSDGANASFPLLAGPAVPPNAGPFSCMQSIETIESMIANSRAEGGMRHSDAYDSQRKTCQTMPYTLSFKPRYSESEIDACIGARGYLYYFQDGSARHFCSFGKGNDRVPDEYGICWILSKYHLKVLRRAPVSSDLQLETWFEPSKSPVRLRPNLRISLDGETCALGQMELCLANVAESSLVRLSQIDFPDDESEHCDIDVPKVRKLKIEEEGMNLAYTYTVRYSDLDNNRHMNNLHYVDLVENAFASSFYEEHPIADLELEYVEQCYEGESIDVLTRVCDDYAEVLARRESGAIALKAVIAFE